MPEMPIQTGLGVLYHTRTQKVHTFRAFQEINIEIAAVNGEERF